MYQLRQLVGRRALGSGRIQEVSHPMDEILVDDESKTNGLRRVGFISRHDGAGIVFGYGLSEGEKQEIRDAVSQLRDERNSWATSDKFSAPAEIPEELLEDEEADEDE